MTLDRVAARLKYLGSVRKHLVAVVAMGALALAGCGSGAGSLPRSHDEQLTSKACQDIETTMTPHSGTVVITLNFQQLIAAVHDAPSARLHSELAAFEQHAAHAGSGASYFNDARAMLRTCRQLGFG